MVRWIGIAIAALAAVVAGFLLFAPTPLDPVAWDAPPSDGYVGAYAPNDALAGAELIGLEGAHGPEDAAARFEGGMLALYLSSQQGAILKLDPRTKKLMTFAETGGVPLGLEFDADGNLVVADAYRGLLSVSPAGVVSVLTDTVDGSPILYADDLDIARDGVVYFSDASTRFGAEAAGSTMQGSIYEIFEHRRTGRVLAYDPATSETRVVATGLSFPNGVAMAPGDDALFVNETGEYRVLRIELSGPDAGKATPVISNLPGFPDNINRGPVLEDGTPTFFLGLAGPRVASVDDLADKPFLRKVVSRLPPSFGPQAQPYGFVMQFTADGEVLRTWQDPAGAYPVTTGAIAPGDGYLYVTSLEAHELARIVYP